MSILELPPNAIPAGNGWWFSEDHTELYGPDGIVIDTKLSKEDMDIARKVRQEYHEHPERFIPFDEAMDEIMSRK